MVNETPNEKMRLRNFSITQQVWSSVFMYLQVTHFNGPSAFISSQDIEALRQKQLLNQFRSFIHPM